MSHSGPFATPRREQRRFRRFIISTFSPIPLVVVIAGGIYAVFVLGEIPQSPDYSSFMPFYVTAEKANGTPPIISRRTVEIDNYSGSPYLTYPNGFLSVNFESPQPIRQTFHFAIGEPAIVSRASLGNQSTEGRSESIFLPLADTPPSNGYTPPNMFPGAWMERGKSYVLQGFTAVTIHVDEPAGQYTLSVSFYLDASSLAYRQGWAKSKVYLDLEDSVMLFTDAYPDLTFVRPEDFTSPIASEVRYYEGNSDITLSEPVPDAEFAEPRSLIWIRENGRISVQFVAENNRTRFFTSRIADIAILVLGAALGTLITRLHRPGDHRT